MSMRIISKGDRRPIMTQGASAASAGPSTKRRIVSPNKTLKRSSSQEQDPLSAAFQVSSLELSPIGQMPGDYILVDLERIDRILDHDIAKCADEFERLSLQEGQRRIQEYNRRFRLFLNARAKTEHAR